MRSARGGRKASTGEAPKLLVGDPQLTATPQEGVTAVCTDPPVWGSLPITKAYHWQLDAADIAAAPGVDPTVSDFPVPTGGTYAGHLLRKAVIYTNSIGSVTRYSNSLAVQASAPTPAPPPPAPAPGGAVAAPTLTGTPTLVASWDFGDSSKITLNGSKISAIAGSDGTAYTLSQATAALQPDAVTVGGYGAARFTGAQLLKLASSLGCNSTDSLTVLIVGEQLQENSQGTLFSLATSSTSGNYGRHRLSVVGTNAGVSPSGVRYTQAGNVTSESVSIGTPLPLGRHLLVGAGGPSTSTNKVFLDSTGSTASASSTFGPAGTQNLGSAPSSVCIGADQDSDFCEFLVWRIAVYKNVIAANLSTNVTEAAAWMASNWGNPTTAGTLTTADLRWSAPYDTTGVDGYKVYWSQTRGGTDFSATVSGVSTLQYTVTGLTSGTWYFTLRTTASGVEGPDVYLKEQTVA